MFAPPPLLFPPKRSKKTKKSGRGTRRFATNTSGVVMADMMTTRYPMLVMTVATLLGLTELLPHQDMLRTKKLLPYDQFTMLGRVIFVSHQWTGHRHADATGLQLRTLQKVLRRLVRGEISKVEMDWKQQITVKKNVVVTAKQFKAALPHMYVWVDYSCIPQPTAGELSEKLIPQEGSVLHGSFLGSFKKSFQVLPADIEEDGEQALPTDIDVGEEEDGENCKVLAPAMNNEKENNGKDPTLTMDKEEENKGKALAQMPPTMSDTVKVEGEVVRDGDDEGETKGDDVATSDHRQADAATPKWMKHVQHWLGKAVDSIPAYIERSALVLVLVPPCEHVDRPGELCDYMNWRCRGWCRLELAGAVMARTDVRLMVVTGASATPEFSFPLDALFLAPGLGTYTWYADD
jgi:hypothetical protein